MDSMIWTNVLDVAPVYKGPKLESPLDPGKENTTIFTMGDGSPADLEAKDMGLGPYAVLTDSEILAVLKQVSLDAKWLPPNYKYFAKAIETAVKEKLCRG